MKKHGGFATWGFVDPLTHHTDVSHDKAPNIQVSSEWRNRMVPTPQSLGHALSALAVPCLSQCLQYEQ